MSSLRTSRGRVLSPFSRGPLSSHSLAQVLANRKGVSAAVVLLACLMAVAVGRELASRPELVLGGMIGLVLLVWLAMRPRLTLITVMVYTPFEEFLLKFVPSQAYALARYLPELLLLAALAVILVRAAIYRQPIRRTPIDIPLFSFVAVSLVSILYNRIPLVVGVLELRILLRYAVAFYIFALAGLDKGFLRRVFNFMLIVFAVQVGMGLLHSIVGDPATSLLSPRNVTIGDLFVRRGFSQIVSSHTRIFSTFGRYNLYGNFVAFFLLFVISALFIRGKSESRGLRTLLMAGLLSLTLSFSRMSWVGFYVGLVFMLFLARKRRVITFLLIPIAATFILFRFYGAEARDVSETAAASVLERYLGMFSRQYVEASLRGDRLYALTTTTRTVLQISPALGLGPGSVASAAARVFGGGERWDVLNLPVENVSALGDVGWAALMAQYGILGLGAFLWILIRVFRASITCFRRARDSIEKVLSLGFLGGFVCVMLENFFSFNFTYRPGSLYFWAFAGMVVAVLGIQRQEQDEKHNEASSV